MSYGYLIATSNPIPIIEQDRRYKFILQVSSDSFYCYTRLEECNGLTIRNSENSFISDEGLIFFNKITSPFFFVDFLLIHKQGELDLVDIYKKKINLKQFSAINPAKQRELKINQLYECVL